MIVVWGLLALLAVLLTVILVRAASFKPATESKAEPLSLAVDEDAAIRRFADLIRFRTVSSTDKRREDPKEFRKLRDYLIASYPDVTAACTREDVGDRGILYRWKGREEGSPSVLMAHYDVVPADTSQWREPPFDGVIRDGELWGRGTLDTKGTLHGIMEAAQAMIRRGFVPEHDVYLAFGGDEEILGTGASDIVALLQKRGITPAFVLDEGGAIVERAFPGVTKPAAVVGIAEKGTACVELTAKGKGGHASAPLPRQALGCLGRALDRLQTHPMPFTLTKPALELFDTLGRHSTFPYRVIFANLWCFGPLLNLICKQSGGEMNALVRTTCALTMAQGSDAFNVLPAQAKASVNLRLICTDDIDRAMARMKKIIADENVTLRLIAGENASRVSATHDEPWNRLDEAIRAAYPGTVVTPYLMLASSDSRHYSKICDHVFRFSGMPLTREQRGLIHNADERLPVSQVKDTVAFYASLLARC